MRSALKASRLHTGLDVRAFPASVRVNAGELDHLGPFLSALLGPRPSTGADQLSQVASFVPFSRAASAVAKARCMRATSGSIPVNSRNASGRLVYAHSAAVEHTCPFGGSGFDELRCDRRIDDVSSPVRRFKRKCRHQPRGASTSPLEEHADCLLTLVADQPDLTLDEVVSAMRKRGIAGSRSAVWRFFQRQKVTFKKTISDSVAPVGMETLGLYPAHGRERPSATHKFLALTGRRESAAWSAAVPCSGAPSGRRHCRR